MCVAGRKGDVCECTYTQPFNLFQKRLCSGLWKSQYWLGKGVWVLEGKALYKRMYYRKCGGKGESLGEKKR